MKKLIGPPMVVRSMRFETALTQSASLARDREVIRVDFDNDSLGIAAALRRAFAAAANDRSDHDFEKLLSELN